MNCGDIIFDEQPDFYDKYAYKSCGVYLEENKVLRVSIEDGLNGDFIKLETL